MVFKICLKCYIKRKKSFTKIIIEFVLYTNEVFILKGIKMHNSNDIISCNLSKEFIL